jgi:hypothetical protein
MKIQHLLLFILSGCLFANLNAQSVAGVDTLLKSGSVNSRINFVYLGDGYTSAQTAQQITDVQNVSDYVFTIPPFDRYKNYFNVFLIKCVSPQSGVSHPGNATDVSEPATPTMAVTNYFNTTFDNGGIHRLMYGNSGNLYTVLATHFPAYDQVLVLGNSTVYGGAGGSQAWASMNASSKEIMVHEVGHSFANLGDEYWAGIGYAFERPNMTANSNTATVKWAPWVGTNTVSVFPYGASAPQNAWFKPHQNCKMQLLNKPFCSVCQQTIIERIHTLTSAIDAYTPANGAAINFTTTGEWFKVKTIKPIPNTLKTKWELNAAPILNNVDSVFLNSSTLNSGSNTLKVSVVDTTNLTRDVNHAGLHTYNVIWNINYTTTGLSSIQPMVRYALFPNPASTELNINYNLPANATVSYYLTDITGKTVFTKQMGALSAGNYNNTIDTEKLPEGVYSLTLVINGKPYSNKVVLAR